MVRTVVSGSADRLVQISVVHVFVVQIQWIAGFNNLTALPSNKRKPSGFLLSFLTDYTACFQRLLSRRDCYSRFRTTTATASAATVKQEVSFLQ